MICLYPAGPIQGENLLESLRNINRGIDWTAKLREAGFSPFPVFEDFQDIMRTRDVPIEGQEGIYEMSLAWLRKADCVFLLPGWAASKGARREKDVAEECGIPIFQDFDRLQEWARVKKEARDEG